MEVPSSAEPCGAIQGVGEDMVGRMKALRGVVSRGPANRAQPSLVDVSCTDFQSSQVWPPQKRHLELKPECPNPTVGESDGKWLPRERVMRQSDHTD